MLVKTGKQIKKGGRLHTEYQERTMLGAADHFRWVDDKTGILSDLAHNVIPSQRFGNRHQEPANAPVKVKTNRKATPGRRIHQQKVVQIISSFTRIYERKNRKGEIRKVTRIIKVVKSTGKSIRHIQETPNALFRKSIHFNLLEKIELNKSKWHKAHPEYAKKEK